MCPSVHYQRNLPEYLIDLSEALGTGPAVCRILGVGDDHVGLSDDKRDSLKCLCFFFFKSARASSFAIDDAFLIASCMHAFCTLFNKMVMNFVRMLFEEILFLMNKLDRDARPCSIVS